MAPGIMFHLVNTLGWSDLRPLQRQAVAPLRAGRHALLVAPTAGGKTEAAILPLLSQMGETPWAGLSVVYVTPLRALLNNLHPRLSGYADWVGRRVGLWHGDTGPGQRAQILSDRPDVLLTTPESLEAMLVSTRVDHRAHFADLRAVIVDELHAFAGDDRGWHLLAVMERLERLASRRLQRIGMTATVGNPEELLTWLTRVDPQSPGVDPGVVIAPDEGAVPPGADVALDYVGSTANAAKVIDLVHPGRKRLVFCQSRSQTEELAAALRARDVATVVSHSSLSADERRIAEQTFADSTNCVVVATSTLELGIDIGDLDHVVQLDAPNTVTSFLQRLGRTGRRPGSTRNMLFLATRESSLVQSAALLSLWRAGFVEPVVPPPSPRHIAAQQLLALALQDGRYPLSEFAQWWPGLPWMRQAGPTLQHLLDAGMLATDSGFAFIGAQSERTFGRRNFLELTSVFTAAPELLVLHGRQEIGSVSPLALTSAQPEGTPRVLSLAGRAWRVTHIDWRRRRAYVTAEAGTGRSVWSGGGVSMGYELAQAIRDVLTGTDPDVDLTQRTVSRLRQIRAVGDPLQPDTGTLLVRAGNRTQWWTFAGSRANESLAAALEAGGVEAAAGPLSIVCSQRVSVREIRACAELLTGFGSEAGGGAPVGAEPVVDRDALAGLKFSSLLPPALAEQTLTQRMTDPARASAVVREPMEVR